MLLRWLVTVTAISLVGLAIGAEPVSFPIKPIRLVVYTKPGGAIDMTARKFADIAGKYTTATFVVENKPGAGGIVAMKDVLRSPADGYTLMACTKSNVAVIVATGDTFLVDSFHWLAMLMSDPECVITRRDIPPSSWTELVADARSKNGEQTWVGPAYGGLDHVMAMKTWERADIRAHWVPYQSGGNAIAELLGGRCVAYVGNPSDIRTNPDRLMIAAVASHQRLDQFPDAQTFQELGIDGLSDEVMWRGFALRKGASPAVESWYEDLFRKVSADEEWRTSYEKDGIDVAYRDSGFFLATVKRDHDEFSNYLGRLGIVRSDVPAPLSRFVSGWYPIATVAILSLACVFLVRWTLGRDSPDGMRVDVGAIVLPIVLLLIAGLLFLATSVFPQADEVGAAAIPRLWLVTLLPLCVVLIWQAYKENRLSLASVTPPTDDAPQSFQTPIDLRAFFLLLLCYVPGLIWLGYYLSTFSFLVIAMYLLGERRLSRVVGVSVGWLFFSYVIFARLLFVPLPIGRLLERLL